MKKRARTLSLRETKARLSEAIDSSQGSYVLVTRHGRPAAIIVGVEGADLTDVAALNEAFVKVLRSETPVFEALLAAHNEALSRRQR